MTYGTKDGILELDGKRKFVIGMSYYASYHPCKWPVAPDGDRDGEMKKDLAKMAEFGVNHVRFAALDKYGLDEKGECTVSCDFVDSMVREADKNGISVSVRLQGYSTNLHGYDNILMLDGEGNVQDVSEWSSFIQTTLFHEGMRKDDFIHSKALAAHFDVFPNVVAYQIYNEPHFPEKMIYDYHPETIKAYRKHLVEKGLMTEEESLAYMPPKTREEQGPEAWARWRVFCTDAITSFVANAAAGAREASKKPLFTCYARYAIHNGTLEGVDPFNGVNAMDIGGYTDYAYPAGQEYFEKVCHMDMNVDAAVIQGKTSWNMELDCRTDMPDDLFEKGVIATLVSGVKGILFYAWRGDAECEGTPEYNGFGVLNCDGSETPNYRTKKLCVNLIQRLNDRLLDSEPAYDGIGVMYSFHAFSACDSMENRGNRKASVGNSGIAAFRKAFEDFSSRGYRICAVDSNGVKDNRLGIKVLIVPAFEMLSNEEKEIVAKFVADGNRVIVPFKNGYYDYGRKLVELPLVDTNYIMTQTLEEVLASLEMKPLAQSSNPLIQTQCKRGKDFDLIGVVNIAPKDFKTGCADIVLSGKYKSAVYETINGTVKLKIRHGVIHLDESVIGNGGIIVATR